MKKMRNLLRLKNIKQDKKIMLPLCGINENLLYTLTKRFNLGYNSMVCIESILSALHGFFYGGY